MSERDTSYAPAPCGDDALSDAFFEARRQDLKARLKRSRYEHTLGVADTAVRLARLYGVDERKARLAGLLHDWDKSFDDEGILRRAEDLGLDVDASAIGDLPALLHGPTAALALSRAYPCIPCDIVRAIELHTTGAIGMSDLDMVVYVADAVEPGRKYDGLEKLRALVGQVSLEELFLATFQHVLLNLIDRRKRVYPRTLEIWNHYLVRAREAAGETPKKGIA